MSDISLLLKNYRYLPDFESQFETPLLEFYKNYCSATNGKINQVEQLQIFSTYIKLVTESIEHSHPFSLFHRSIRVPFDYYRFGLDFIRPLIHFEESTIFGFEQLDMIRTTLKRGENVILLSNHQTEPDPQIISLMLEKIDPEMASQMIFVAGHRVTHDPLAIPMSLGRNLLCIHSKKHMGHLSSEEKREKIVDNRRAMQKMEELLNEGGKCIYVAPSGGRDRPQGEKGVIPAILDPDSIELFFLISQRSTTPTHFHSLTLKTYDIMPPPNDLGVSLGETRIVCYAPVFLSFGKEIEMNEKTNENTDKKQHRVKRAALIWETIMNHYNEFPSKKGET